MNRAIYICSIYNNNTNTIIIYYCFLIEFHKINGDIQSFIKLEKF